MLQFLWKSIEKEKSKMFCICIIIICIVLFLHEIYKRISIRDITSKMPTAFGFPIIGIAHEMTPARNFLHLFSKYSEKFKSHTYCAYIANDPFVITMDLEVLRNVLTSEDYLNKARLFYAPLNHSIPNGLVNSTVDKWRHNRKLLNASFTNTVLMSFIPMYNVAANNIIRQFNDLVGAGEQDIYRMMRRMILQLSFETTMGVPQGDGEKYDEKFINSILYLGSIFFKIVIFSAAKLAFLARTPSYYKNLYYLRNYVQKIIDEKSEALDITQNTSTSGDDSLKKPKDIFINQALNYNRRGLFGINDVISESHTMITASYEALSTTAFSTLVMLAMHPEIQEKLYDEICCVFPNKDATAEYEDMLKVPYLDMVVDEVLRLMPSVPIIARETIRSTSLTEDILLPERMQVIIPIFNLHRRKDIWGPNADKFNPDNFLPENNRDRHPYAYIPFSKSARNCIGWRYANLSVKVILIRLIRNFKFYTTFKFEDLVLINNVTLRYEVEPKLKLEKRKY